MIRSGRQVEPGSSDEIVLSSIFAETWNLPPGSRWAVFAVTGERASTRDVRVGQRGALKAEVLAGLTEGDAVVIHPGASVRDGSRVASRFVP